MAIDSHIQLPVQILKHFRDETDPEKKVWYLDISKGEIYKKAAKKLGVAKGYYSENGEKFWGQYVESPLGVLNKKIRSFCSGESEQITITPEDVNLAKRYIKSAAVRSNLAYMAMRESSTTADLFSEQENHDALSVFGMNSKGPFDQLFADLSVTVIANRTDRQLVVPRNCYYCVTRLGVRNFVIPISPQSAFLLLPTEHLNQVDNGYGVIDDPTQVEVMNVLALKYEYMFNADFVASNCRAELEFLRKFQQENRALLENLRNSVV